MTRIQARLISVLCKEPQNKHLSLWEESYLGMEVRLLVKRRNLLICTSRHAKLNLLFNNLLRECRMISIQNHHKSYKEIINRTNQVV